MRRFALIAAVVIGTLGPAFAQSTPPRPAGSPADTAPDALPVDPLAVPRWMGNTIENILTGDDQPDKKQAPARQ